MHNFPLDKMFWFSVFTLFTSTYLYRTIPSHCQPLIILLPFFLNIFQTISRFQFMNHKYLPVSNPFSQLKSHFPHGMVCIYITRPRYCRCHFRFFFSFQPTTFRYILSKQFLIAESLSFQFDSFFFFLYFYSLKI